MGEKEPSKGLQKGKEIFLKRPITENDIEEFNKMVPIVITLKDTKGQDPNILAKLDSRVTIRIIGGFNEKSFPEYAHEKYFKKTLYSPLEVSKLINILEEIESTVDPEWTNLEKATYGYITLMRNIHPLRNQEYSKEEKEERPLAQILNMKADSFGYAFVYKELLERMGIACRYMQSNTPHAWNEVLIDGEYYPADLFYDASLNEKALESGEFELRSFLSNKNFYNVYEHQAINYSKDKETPVLDHSEIQSAINTVLNPNKKEKIEIPKIPLKSNEIQKALGTDIIENVESFDSRKEIKISFESQDSDLIREDLLQIAKYYPQVLDNVRLSNDMGIHIDMQGVVDAIYEGRSNSKDKRLEPSQIVIESSIPEDFDLDFSKAPELDMSVDDETRIEDVSYSQKIAFVNTSSAPIKLPDLSRKIPARIDTISIQDFDVEGFNISSNDVDDNAKGVNTGVRRLELIGGGTQGIADIVGLDKVISLKLKGLNDAEFDSVMNIAIKDTSTMPRLFELDINNQNLQNRAFFSEIENPNIVKLKVHNSSMNNITGLDELKNQLVSLYVGYNNFSIDDLKKISEISNEKQYFRRGFLGNNSLNSTINNLTGNFISDDTYNYLDSYFRRSGYEDYRNLNYVNMTNPDSKKKQMLIDFARWDLEKVPYFIEDAELMRKILPYTSNPMMVKDLVTFQNYLNDPSNYFDKDYLKDGKLWLTKEQLDYLISTRKTIPQKIYIKINTASELSKQELSNFKNMCNANGINLVGVNIFDDRCIDSVNSTRHNFDGKDTIIDSYGIDEYEKIREALDEIVDGITPSMSDAEKFAVVYYRLAKKIPIYNHPIATDELSKEHAIYNAINFCKSRNLSQGLIEQEGFDLENNKPDTTIANRCVCVGYADILKNALELAGIQCIIDSGYAKYNKTKNTKFGGHAWNKVKIDGKWYYADLCWDAKKTSYEWALKGSDKFEHSNITKHDENDDVIEVCHITRIKPGQRHEQVEKNDYDQAELSDIFYKVQHDEIPPKYVITIPDNPDFSVSHTLEIDKIKDEYKRRKEDMLAKYYGNKDYQEKYNQIAARYRANEVEVTNGGYKYKTIQDYAERQEDEKFLILGEYKNSLERMSKYEAGDTSVYSGTPDQITAQYEKDKEYVETRNYTFDQHKNTQKDLATLGKFGETMPYIPKQTGIVKNGLRIVANAGIFARNLVAPVYRFIGRNVAQPLHRLVTRGKDASPYRNNPYHRFVARRDYFKDIAKQEDEANGKKHPIKNYFMSNINAVAKYKVGNEAVLKAGAYDIQSNLKEQELQRMELDFLNTKKSELEAQITFLENEIANHADAQNISEANQKLNIKRSILQNIEQNIISVNTTGKIIDIQTDAISQTQHDIASKEVNTYRVAVIKGVAKLGVKKFVGPKIKDWLIEHSKQKVAREEVYQETIYVEKEVQDPSIEVPITEERPYYDIEVDDLIEQAKGKTVKMYRSVSGGNKGEIGYTINGNEACTGFHFQDGTTWGTGYSSNVPLMTDQYWPSSFLDASNNLRDDLTFSEIAQAISNGELSEELLENMTVQIGNKGWVYANELLDGITQEVEVGTKIIEGATHTEMVEELVDRVRTVYDIVDNERVVNALDTLGVAMNTAGKVDTVHNVAEIVRPTTSKVNSNKRQTREYTYDDSEFYI